MIDLIPLDEDRLRALIADPAGKLGALGSNADAVADVARSVAEATLPMYGKTGARFPWIGYLARRSEGRAIVGTCAFKGPPSDGAVEIAYFTFPGYEGQGCASAMAGALVRAAFGEPIVTMVVAHTLPEENPSTRVLRRHGFQLQGTVEDEEDGEIWRWSLSRNDGSH